MNIKRLAFVLLLTASVFGQTYKDGSGFGFGITSPRMFGDIYSEFLNFGAHALYQKDFDEQNSLRFKVDYLAFTAAKVGSVDKTSNTTIGIHADYLFRVVPCAPMKIYLGTGLSLLNFKLEDANTGVSDKDWRFAEIGFSFIIGSQYTLNQEWDLRAELTHSTVSTDKFDGTYGAQGGLFGGVLDSYVGAEFGAIYYFARGEKSKYCEAPSGLTQNYYTAAASVDYDKLQKMIEAAQPKQMPADIDYAKIESMIDKKLAKLAVPVESKTIVTQGGGELALVGINFDANSAVIKAENFPILAQAAQTLLSYPAVKVEIHGYTDAQGAEAGNKKLSEKRATAVKNFLVAKGVDASRLTLAGFGESNPVSDNKTNEGRLLNRRVEFKIIK